MAPPLPPNCCTCKNLSLALDISKHTCNRKKKGYRATVFDPKTDSVADQLFLCKIAYLKTGANNRLSELVPDRNVLANFKNLFGGDKDHFEICYGFQKTIKKLIKQKNRVYIDK